MSLGQGVLLLVAVQRLIELAYARRNTARLLAAGGYEVAAGHYPLFILLHGAWLAALSVLVPADAPVDGRWLAIFVVLQVGRVWVMVSLGGRWTTRIIVSPGVPLVRRGPYRVLRHPNYIIVAAEVAVLPLAFGAWRLALVFSVLNAALLAWRLRAENRALAAQR